MASQVCQEFESAFESALPPRDWRDSHVVIAVSGGADSVAMLRAASTIKKRCEGQGQVFAAHLNHGMRGGESDEDARWVHALCDDLGVQLVIGRADVADVAAQVGDGLEAAARAARYDFLTETAERLGARFVTTAHTADDQVETVLFRILRGTGIAGLRGIPAKRTLSPSVALVRPLLELRRRDVVAYLAELGQEYRTDATNDDSQWTRNWLRNDVLPILRERYSTDLDSALLRLATQANETQAVIDDIVRRVAESAIEVAKQPSGEGEQRTPLQVRLHCGRLAGEPPLIVREVCKAAWQQAGWSVQAMGFTQWQVLAGMIRGTAGSARANLPGNVHARRGVDVLVLSQGGLP